MSSYLVGCDIGTSSTKSVVMDEEGTVLGKLTIPYPTHTNSLGWAEHDPDDYWNTTADTIAEAIRQSGVDPKDIKGCLLYTSFWCRWFPSRFQADISLFFLSKLVLKTS